MAVEFCCENCGKLLSVEAQPGEAVKCSHCHKKVSVPVALAALPRPQIPGASPMAAPPPALPPGQPGMEQQEEGEHENEAVMSVMAKIMPWIISVFFHVGIFMLTLLGGALVALPKIPMQVIIPDGVLSDDPGGVPSPGSGDANLEAHQNQKQQNDHGYARNESPVPSGVSGVSSDKSTPIGLGGGGGGGPVADFGLTGGGSGAGPKSSFFGHGGGNVYHIVYVIDRSGSMIDTFDYVRQEMLMSISKLAAAQNFHVIMFADGPPIENAPKKLVAANKENKTEVADFLSNVRAQGKTDPIPAMMRAFEVLDRSDKAKQGKIVYLLTDGVFPDNAAVLTAIKDRNKNKDVHIFTFLYGNRPAPAVEVMETIAKENGGKYKYIASDE